MTKWVVWKDNSGSGPQIAQYGGLTADDRVVVSFNNGATTFQIPRGQIMHIGNEQSVLEVFQNESARSL